MTKKLVGVAATVAVCLSASAIAQQAKQMPAPPPQASVDFAALAEKLVGTNANIKEGQVVQIIAGPIDTALAEELAIAIRKRGAHALISYESESLRKKTFESVPAKYDAKSNKIDIALAKLIDAVIIVPQLRDESIFAALPPDRARALTTADMAVRQTGQKRKVKVIELGNGLAPSASRAKELGVSEAELKKLYWDGLTADYAAIEQKCTALKDAVAKGKELKITHANGTDLTIAIKGKKVFTSDGVISDADKAAGAVEAWLPAGEVYLVPGVSNGKVVDDRAVALGKEILGRTVEIKAGKITNLTSKSGWDGSPLKARYDAAGPRKNELSVVDFGCNPAVKNDKLESWIPAGMVTFIFGNNQWAKGTNSEPFDMNVQLPGATVLLDGKAIIENGALK
jgi:leucyl aminopeptidase (aminopeptidase T)